MMKNISSLDTLLIEAAKRGEADKARAAMASGASLLATDEQGMTAAHWAAQKGDAEMAQLVASPESALATDILRRTPLHIACLRGETEVALVLLLANESALAARDVDGRSPLHHAAESGISDLARVVLARGGQAAELDGHGQTPAMIARENGYKALALLIDAAPCVSLGSWRGARAGLPATTACASSPPTP
jgi:ankyrin repeat protein